MEKTKKDQLLERVKKAGNYNDILVNGEIIVKGGECRQRLDVIKKYVSKGNKVLDVGSHSGYFAIELARIGADVLSIENNKELADVQIFLSGENNVKVDVMLRELNLKTFYPIIGYKKFDVILLLNVVHYWGENITEMLEKLRDIGKKIIIEFPRPYETEAIYNPLVVKLSPFEKYLKKIFGEVELLATTPSPNNKDKLRNIFLCQK